MEKTQSNLQQMMESKVAKHRMEAEKLEGLFDSYIATRKEREGEEKTVVYYARKYLIQAIFSNIYVQCFQMIDGVSYEFITLSLFYPSGVATTVDLLRDCDAQPDAGSFSDELAHVWVNDHIWSHLKILLKQQIRLFKVCVNSIKKRERLLRKCTHGKIVFNYDEGVQKLDTVTATELAYLTTGCKMLDLHRRFALHKPDERGYSVHESSKESDTYIFCNLTSSETYHVWVPCIMKHLKLCKYLMNLEFIVNYGQKVWPLEDGTKEWPLKEGDSLDTIQDDQYLTFCLRRDVFLELARDKEPLERHARHIVRNKTSTTSDKTEAGMAEDVEKEKPSFDDKCTQTSEDEEDADVLEFCQRKIATLTETIDTTERSLTLVLDDLTVLKIQMSQNFAKLNSLMSDTREELMSKLQAYLKRYWKGCG